MRPVQQEGFLVHQAVETKAEKQSRPGHMVQVLEVSGWEQTARSILFGVRSCLHASGIGCLCMYVRIYVCVYMYISAYMFIPMSRM